MGCTNTKMTKDYPKKPSTQHTGYNSQQISESPSVVPPPEPVELNYTVFIGKYDYDSRTDNDLSFKKGIKIKYYPVNISVLWPEISVMESVIYFKLLSRVLIMKFHALTGN